MKKKIALAVLLLALLAAGIGLRAFLEYGLNSAIRKYAAPAFREKTGVALEIRRIGVRLLSGAALLEGVAVGNPAGFDEPVLLKVGSCNLNIGLSGLARGRIEQVKSLAVEDGVLTIVRNAEGDKNVQKLAQAFAARPRPGGKAGERKRGAAQAPEQGQDSGPAPGIHLSGAVIRGRIEYIDHMPGRLQGALADEGAGGPFSLALDASIRMKDIATFGDADLMSGSVTVKASLASCPSSCTFAAFGKVAPIVDPNRPTFELDGAFNEVELKLFKPYLEGSYVEDGRASGEFKLVCRRGEIDREESHLTLAIEKLTLSGALRRQFGGVSPEKMTVTIPIGGSLQAPEMDFKDAVKQALLDPKNLMSIVKAFSSQGTNAASSGPAGGDGPGGAAHEALGALLGGLKGGERQGGATNANGAAGEAAGAAGESLP